MQQDQNEKIRATIDRAIKKRGRGTQAALERYIGAKKGYLTGYLSKGSPRELKYEMRSKISKMLEIEPELLGVGDKGEHDGDVPNSDATVYVPAPSDAITPQPHYVFLRAISHSMDEHPENRIEPGNIAAFDTRETDVRKIDTGRIVYAQRRAGRRVDTLIRQFIAPDKLATNSSTGNEIIRLSDADITIMGALRYVVRDLVGG